MRVFSEHIRKSVSNRLGIEIDVFVSPKRWLVHFALKQPLSYPLYKEPLHFVRKEWKVL